MAEYTGPSYREIRAEMDERARLEATDPAAQVPGPGDRVYQPTLWDGDGEGATTEVMTDAERAAWLLRVWHEGD